MAATGRNNTKARNNGTIVAACLTFVVAMIGMAYAAVPLYQMFCQVTGYNGTTRRVEQMSDRVLDRMIKVRFDANTAGNLPWEFQPVKREIEVRIGETVEVMYKARNVFPAESTGQATFNVTPMQAGVFFNKVQCFCFTETTLKGGEEMEMPVVFYVDPAIVDEAETRNIGTITLSYTFYPHEKTKPVASVSSGQAADAAKKL